MNRLFLNSNRTEYNELYCILRTALLKGTNELPIFVLLSFEILSLFNLYLKIALKIPDISECCLPLKSYSKCLCRKAY